MTWSRSRIGRASTVRNPDWVAAANRGHCWLGPARSAAVRPAEVVALVINLAIVAYLLFAKRLFGLRGGGKAERADHEEDTGWAPIERATPMPLARGRNGVADHGSRPAQLEPSGANGRPA